MASVVSKTLIIQGGESVLIAFRRRAMAVLGGLVSPLVMAARSNTYYFCIFPDDSQPGTHDVKWHDDARKSLIAFLTTNKIKSQVTVIEVVKTDKDLAVREI